MRMNVAVLNATTKTCQVIQFVFRKHTKIIKRNIKIFNRNQFNKND